MVGDALEKTQVQFCKVNFLPELYPEKVSLKPSPLALSAEEKKTYSLQDESFVEPNTFII